MAATVNNKTAQSSKQSSVSRKSKQTLAKLTRKQNHALLAPFPPEPFGRNNVGTRSGTFSPSNVNIRLGTGCHLRRSAFHEYVICVAQGRSRKPHSVVVCRLEQERRRVPKGGPGGRLRRVRPAPQAGPPRALPVLGRAALIAGFGAHLAQKDTFVGGPSLSTATSRHRRERRRYPDTRAMAPS